MCSWDFFSVIEDALRLGHSDVESGSFAEQRNLLVRSNLLGKLRAPRERTWHQTLIAAAPSLYVDAFRGAPDKVGARSRNSVLAESGDKEQPCLHRLAVENTLAA